MASVTKTKYPGVYKRTDSHGETSFYIVYRRGGKGSKQIKESVGKASEGMTAAKANNIRADRIKGALSKAERRAEASKPAPVEGTRWTLSKLWDLYQELHPNQKSRDSDIGRFNNYLSKPFGSKTVDELTTTDVDRLRNQILDKRKPATAHKVLELMCRIVNFGNKQGLITIPGKLHFNMPKVDNEKTEFYTNEQMDKFWKAADDCKDPFFASFMKFVAYTGVRRAAGIALRWDDCDFARGFITLRGESAKNGKTCKIPMGEKVTELLQKIPHQNGEFVFPQLHKDTYTNKARKFEDAAGLPKDFRPIHGLRHNFASRLVSEGNVPLPIVQCMLVHASPAMTQRYAHLSNDALKRAASVADNVLSPKGT